MHRRAFPAAITQITLPFLPGQAQPGDSASWHCCPHDTWLGSMQVDPDKAFAIQIAHEESVLTTPTAYVQCALLYTSSTGERRIRCCVSSIYTYTELQLSLLVTVDA